MYPKQQDRTKVQESLWVSSVMTRNTFTNNSGLTQCLYYSYKDSSQSDAMPCIALILGMQNFLIKMFSDLLAIRHKNSTQNTRIAFESILALHCVATSVNVKVMQCNALCSIVLWTGQQNHQYQLVISQYLWSFIHLPQLCSLWKSQMYTVEVGHIKKCVL